MGPFRYHVFVCELQKAEGMPCCAARGSAKVLEVLRREVAERGLANEVLVTACGSFGLCERGPNLIVYPEGVWYSGVGPQDVPEIVQTHFQGGRALERLANKDVPALKQEICANRDKALAAQRARAASGVLPDDMNRNLRGFQENRVILTAFELGVFTAVGNGATAVEVAARMGGAVRATEMLLNDLVAMGWLTKHDDVLGDFPLSSRYFVAGSADDWRAAALHFVRLLRTLPARYRLESEQWPRLRQLLSAHQVDTVLDVGANTGQYAKSLREVGFTGRVISFEPLSGAHSELCRAAHGDSLWTVAERMAIGDRDGLVEIHVANNSVSSSILPMLAQHRMADPASVFVATETVPIARLDSIAPRFLHEAKSIFLKIDVQGFEKKVLEGAPDLLERIVGIQLEVSLVTLYEGETLFLPMIEYLREMGFDLWGLIPGFADPRTGRLLQVDGVFFTRRNQDPPRNGGLI